MALPLRPVGFYVHYHGRGHRNRTLAILNQMLAASPQQPRPVAILASRMDGLDWPANVKQVLELACDIDGVPAAGLARAEDVPSLHFAPLHTPTIRRRVHQLAEWFDRSNPAAVVIDVSAEVTQLARLASVPTIVMRQHGDRRDAAHEAAYHAADRLLAPFPESLEDDITPGWVREKTTYAAGFCRYTEPAPSREQAREQLEWATPHVVVMSGRGGDGSNLDHIADAAAAMPDVTWVVIGMTSQRAAALPSNVNVPGWIDNPLTYLAAADVVVSAGGHNSVMELAHARARTVIIPEPRPFEEQVRKAAVLKRQRLSLVRDRWPDAADWPALVHEASDLDGSRWAAITDGNGAATLAAAIETVAQSSERVARTDASK